MTYATTDTDATSLAYLEPGVDILLALLKAGINADLQPAWTDAATGTQLEGRAPVQNTFPFSPTPELMRSAKMEFPVLFCHPIEDPTTAKHTTTQSRITQRWALEYIMGPLTTEEIRKIGGAIRYVQKIVNGIAENGGHISYALDGNSVQASQVLIGEGAGTCGFDTFKYVSATPPGAIAFSESGPTYWGTVMIVESTEPVVSSTASADVAHTGGRFFLGTGTGVDDDATDDDNGIIEEQIEGVTAV